MAPPRRSGGTRARPGPEKNQSILSFTHSKPHVSSQKDLKKASSPGSDISSGVSRQNSQQEPADDDVIEIHEVIDDDTQDDVSEEWLAAEKMPKNQVEVYWREIEAGGLGKRVHQEDLGCEEKVLRYFDASSQYGPCVGISRMKRWERAHRLGLNPPLEILAALISEEKNVGTEAEDAHIDIILNPRLSGMA